MSYVGYSDESSWNENRFRSIALLTMKQDDACKFKKEIKANLSIMYYHLLMNVLSRRWSTNINWEIYADNTNIIKWDDLSTYLNSKNIGTIQNYVSGGSKQLI